MADVVAPCPDERWSALTATAAAVRASSATEPAARHPSRWPWLVYAALLGSLLLAGLHALGSAQTAHADASADADLFSLTNQDRASNGVRSLAFNGTLSTIGEGGRYTGCGFTVYGRSVDMIQRNYFAHPILGCGQLVFSIMQAYGVHYLSAGENIGWNTYPGAATGAAQINAAFMNSPEHRTNILNAAYTDLGIGSDNSGSVAWTGGGGSHTDAWMFSEEFAQLHGSAPPPPRPPTPAPRTGAPVAQRNSPAPAPPAQPPAVVAQTAAVPATPAATPPVLTVPPGLSVPPLLEQPGGLLVDSVESVLESYLIG